MDGWMDGEAVDGYRPPLTTSHRIAILLFFILKAAALQTIVSSSPALKTTSKTGEDFFPTIIICYAHYITEFTM